MSAGSPLHPQRVESDPLWLDQFNGPPPLSPTELRKAQEHNEREYQTALAYNEAVKTEPGLRALEFERRQEAAR